MLTLKKIINSGLFLLGLFFVGVLLRSYLKEFYWENMSIRPIWLVAALLVNLSYVGLYACLWKQLAEASELRLPSLLVYGISFYALALKYLPVRVAGVGYRLWAFQHYGGWPLAQTAAVLYAETALVLFSGCSVLLLSSPWVSWLTLGLGVAPLALCAGAMVGLWLLPITLAWLTRSHPRWQWLRRAAAVARGSLSPAPLLRYTGAWVVLGTSLWLTLGALGEIVTADNWIVCLWAYALAGLAGMLAIFAPAGLGVREGVLALALGTVFSPGTAALAALAARILILFSEAFWAVLGHWLLQKAKTQTKSSTP